MTVTYPRAPSEEMETLMMDPITNQLYILTKNHEEAIAYIYKVHLNYNFRLLLIRKFDSK